MGGGAGNRPALASRSGCLCDQVMIGQKIGEQTPSPPRLAGKPEGWAMESTEGRRKEVQRLWERMPCCSIECKEPKLTRVAQSPSAQPSLDSKVPTVSQLLTQ